MDSLTFWSGSGIALAVSLMVVAYLRTHLRGLLAELCGTRQRGDFWLAFSNVMLILMPLIFALENGETVQRDVPATLAIAAQMQRALLGLVATVITIGVVLSMFIARVPAEQRRSEPALKS